MFADAAVREAGRPASPNGRIGPAYKRRPTANGSNGDGRSVVTAKSNRDKRGGYDECKLKIEN
jgi:hypothetical protein